MKKVDTLNTGIFITVRTGSSRLPGKALKEVMGRPIISFLISRIKKINENIGKVIICTTSLSEDNVLDDIAKDYGVSCFHGDKDNIIKRHLECANEYNIDFIVNIDGDDILCDPEYVKLIIKHANESNDYDVVKTCDLPFGTNSMGYKKNVLTAILQKIEMANIDTGWGLLINDKSVFAIKEIFAAESEKSDCRLTLDYEEDFILFKNIIQALFIGEEYVAQKSVIDYINNNPEIKNINSHLNEKYWQNFNKNRLPIEGKKENKGIECK